MRISECEQSYTKSQSPAFFQRAEELAEQGITGPEGILYASSEEVRLRAIVDRSFVHIGLFQPDIVGGLTSISVFPKIQRLSVSDNTTIIVLFDILFLKLIFFRLKPTR